MNIPWNQLSTTATPAWIAQDEWLHAAWTAGWESYRRRVAEHLNGADWHRPVDPDEYVRVHNALFPTARAAITTAIQAEPDGSYYGTESCWVNAARGAVDGLAFPDR